MGFQEFLLAVLERTLSRATGLIYLSIGAAISAVEYLNANPKPEYFLTNSIGNLLIYVGLATVVVRTIERWKKSYEEKQRRQTLLRTETQRLEQSALANLPVLDNIYRSALKAQVLTGQQRFLVGGGNGLLARLVDLHIIVRPDQLGQRGSSGVYIINPAIWSKRQEIIDDDSVNGDLRPGWFSRRA
ncbi:hypothetical protein [Agrobacterium rosae]|uniref:hypothetical protein n=1 Tax=Agrobacterium rosae TaxID=1972867 RepID=UPI000D44A471|nr:hypothetical protein [Agrobacterium rosae]POO56268.1 hypothetical protein CTT39_05910 [Agrobacterium rosae]